MTKSFGDFVELTQDGTVATVTLDRGDGRNAMSLKVMQAMIDAASYLASDTSSHGIIEDFREEMVVSALVGATYIHTGTFPYRFEAFKNLDIFRTIARRISFHIVEQVCLLCSAHNGFLPVSPFAH